MEKLGNYYTNRIEDKIFDMFKSEFNSKERLLSNFEITSMIKNIRDKDDNQENISSKIIYTLEEIKLLTNEECSLQLENIFNFYRTLI
jgi:hypothetical protein